MLHRSPAGLFPKKCPWLDLAVTRLVADREKPVFECNSVFALYFRRSLQVAEASLQSNLIYTTTTVQELNRERAEY